MGGAPRREPLAKARPDRTNTTFKPYGSRRPLAPARGPFMEAKCNDHTFVDDVETDRPGNRRGVDRHIRINVRHPRCHRRFTRNQCWPGSSRPTALEEKPE